MLKTFIFNEVITTESVSNLMREMDEYQNSPEFHPDLPIDLYFATPGGEIGISYAFVNYINSFPCNNMTLILFGECSSAGMIVAGLLETDLNILPTAYGMIHMPETFVSTREMNKDKSYDSFVVKEMYPEISELLLDYYSDLDLNEKEYDIILNNDDLHLNNKRFSEILISYRENKWKAYRIQQLREELAVLENSDSKKSTCLEENIDD